MGKKIEVIGRALVSGAIMTLMYLNGSFLENTTQKIFFGLFSVFLCLWVVNGLDEKTKEKYNLNLKRRT